MPLALGERPIGVGGQPISARRFLADGSISEPVLQHVVAEDMLSIEIEQVGSYALMWTPTHGSEEATGYTAEEGLLTTGDIPESLALAAGFALTEGLIEGLEDIADMAVCQDRPDVVRIRLSTPDKPEVRRRNVIVNSSCGICGGREQLSASMTCMAPVGDHLRLRGQDFSFILDNLRNKQGIFQQTGGAHAALVFSPDLEILAFAEDLGRHNALDKVIGQCLLQGLPFAGSGVFVSSRISYEMLAKSARAGFEMIAAISAPTSLAIEMADRLGITLCGFVRGNGGEIYTHPHRIVPGLAS